MKILKMTASFGKLQKQELTLEPGLNVITAPNEAGKSTWASFLLAMLYGIDTAERATKGTLPAKVKFKPWSGSAMEGRMEVEHQGRRIVIERSSKGRVPMGEFRAYDKDTMQPVPGMTGENCGELLLGAGRSVFARSAFVAQGDTAVSRDAGLEQKLASLVTTGDETVRYADCEKRLRDWKNRCQHNKTGELPQARGELEQVSAVLDQIHMLHRGSLDLRARQEELTGRKARLEQVLTALQAEEARKKLAQRDQAGAEAKAAAARRDELAAQAAALPADEVLEELNQNLVLFRRAASTLPQQSPAQPPQIPSCPAVFAGLAEDQIVPKAKADKVDFDRLTAGVRLPLWPYLTGFAALLISTIVQIATGKAAETFPLVLITAVAAVMALLCGFLARKKNRAFEARRDQAYAILKAYEDRSADELVPFATEYCGALQLYHHQLDRYEAEKAELVARREDVSREQARLLGQVSMFAPQARDLDQAAAAIAAAQDHRRALGQAEREAQTAQARYETLCAALGDLKAPPAPEMDLSGQDPERVRMELGQIQGALAALQTRLDQEQGRAEALGDPAQLTARQEQAQQRIRALEGRYAALSLAAETLEKANQRLQTRFAPQIAALAGKLLARLTGERYDTVLLDSDLRAEARESGEAVTRQLLALSGGTVDQVYLAVRLAICRLALGEDVPLVLDDALVRFDDERMEKAVALLAEEARSRQILLFTCQGREQAALEQIRG